MPPKFYQFGDELDDAALEELASGPLIRRINLSANRPGGLQECTREMFSLAMLVRLGKVTEDDILDTFNAFNRLDVSGEGVLNSRSIIAGMINKSRHKAGMSRVSSTNSFLREQHGNTALNQSHTADGIGSRSYVTASAYDTPRVAQGYGTNSVGIPSRAENRPSTETSSLLHDDSDYYSMLSRSVE